MAIPKRKRKMCLVGLACDGTPIDLEREMCGACAEKQQKRLKGAAPLKGANYTPMTKTEKKRRRMVREAAAESEVAAKEAAI